MGLDTKTATGVRACRTGFRPNRGTCLDTRFGSDGHAGAAASAVRKLADLLKVAVGFEAVDGRHVRHMHAVEAAVFDDHVQHALLPRRLKIRVDGTATQRAHRTDKRMRAQFDVPATTSWSVGTVQAMFSPWSTTPSMA